MSDVFISYAREDQARAKILAGALEDHGISVWWDPNTPLGKDFYQVLEEELNKAKCVIVLWSKMSVRSEWVKDEAAEGKRQNKLVPAKIEDVKAPLGFRGIQTADIIDWDGKTSHQEFQKLLEAVSNILQISDVFISYNHEDKDEAGILASALEDQSISVWWDPNIRFGDNFSKVIEEELDKAKCVVVLWSKTSVKSRWVKDEATEGKRQKKLVPVKIEDVKAPLRFLWIRTACLIDWKGNPSHPGFNKLLKAVRKILCPPSAKKYPVRKIIVSSLAILITLVLIIIYIMGRPPDLILTGEPHVDCNDNEVSFKFKQSDPNLCTGKVYFTVKSDLGDAEDKYKKAMINGLNIEAGELRYNPRLETLLSNDKDETKKIYGIEYWPKEPNEYHILTVTVSSFPVLLVIDSEHLKNDNVIEWSSEKGIIRNGAGIVKDPYKLKE